MVLDDWLGMEGRQYASLTCGLACPRQNGKNGLLEVRELFGMVGRGEKILHTAHEVKTARKAFKRLLFFFGRQLHDPDAKYPELNALVTEFRHVNGQEAIVLANGGSVEIVARSKNSGRGFTADVLVMDEAQELSDDDLEALMPTTSAAPLGNPQWIFTGTPPGPKAAGEVFTRTRTDALSSAPFRMTWHEWSADGETAEDIDIDDRDLWHLTNPALGSRLQMAVLEGERSRFTREGFCRERLGWWKPAALVSAGDLDVPAWLRLADPSCAPSKPLVLGVDQGEDRLVNIGAAWRSSGRVTVMLTQTDEQHVDVGLAPEQAVLRLAELRERWGARVVLGGPAVGLERELREAGVPCEVMSASDFATSCGQLDDRLRADRLSPASLRHGNQSALTESVTVARWRKVGTAGERAFLLADTPGIGPVAAVTRALGGLLARPATSSGPVAISAPSATAYLTDMQF